MFAMYQRVVEVARPMPQSIDSILDAAEQQQASDVFLQEDEVPRLKVNEQIVVLGDEPLSLAHLIDAGKIKPIVTQVLPLSEAIAAQKQAATHHTRGKIVLRIADELQG
jgi:NADPH:quinone reductase-like Zn-dependent oxidoreductase